MFYFSEEYHAKPFNNLHGQITARKEALAVENILTGWYV